MRILQVSCACAPFHGGGVAGLIDRLSRAMIRAGHEVMVFTHGDEPRRPRNSVVHRPMADYDVAAVNQPEPGFFQRYAVEDYLNPSAHEAFRTVASEFRPDVVHFHAIQGLGAGLLDWVPDGVPALLTMHDFWWVCPNLFLVRLDERLCELTAPNLDACVRCLSPLPQLDPKTRFELPQLQHRQNYLMRQLKRFARVLAVSSFLRDRLTGFLPGVRIDVIENGIDVAPEQAARLRALHDRRRGEGYANGRVRFGFVGGLNHYKGFDCLTRAVPLVRESNIEVEIHGTPGAGRKRLAQHWPWLRHAYRRLRGRPADPGLPSLDARIRLCPEFSAEGRGEIFASFDALLVPSIVHESFSLVCREALAVGVPVIASRCGGPEEIVRHGENGLLFEAGSAAGLADCMQRFAADRVLAASLAAQARFEGIRTVAQQADDLLAIYADATMQR